MLLLLVCIGLIAEMNSSNGTKTNETQTDVVEITPPLKKWYAGYVGGAGIHTLDTQAIDNYYSSIGYHSSGFESFWNGMLGNHLVGEAKVYTGYRMSDNRDVEFGYSYSGVTISGKYQSFGNTVSSRREVTAHALYAAALLRPPEGHGHALYLKLGGHLSHLQVSKSVTGTPPNLDVIAAGDRMQGDGASTGVGTLVGVGVDFRTGNVGAIRMELNHSYMIGRTNFGKATFALGYQVNY